MLCFFVSNLSFLKKFLVNNNLNEIFLTAKGNVGDKYLQNTTIYDYLSALPSNYRYALFTSSGSGYGVTDYPVDGWFNYFCFTSSGNNQWVILATALTFDAFYVGRIYNGALTWKQVY